MRHTKDIHWYPGHMAKAVRTISADIALVDVTVEMLDARFPRSSSNEDLSNILQAKPRIVALNKADAADPDRTENWLSYFQSLRVDAVALDSISGDGLGRLLQLVRKAGGPAVEKLVHKGLRQRPLRIMVVGIPNVGKSSLVNRLSRRTVVKTADKAGVTRGRQWLRIAADIDLLDTPGILPTSMPDRSVALRLAAGGAIKEGLFDVPEVACFLTDYLNRFYPGLFARRYLPENVLPFAAPEDALAAAARNKGMLGKQGVLQIDNMARIILSDFRQGRIGRITLEQAPESV